jgi:hypothetical protein
LILLEFYRDFAGGASVFSLAGAQQQNYYNHPTSTKSSPALKKKSVVAKIENFKISEMNN